jgi:hypothetical protein
MDRAAANLAPQPEQVSCDFRAAIMSKSSGTEALVVAWQAAHGQ